MAHTEEYAVRDLLFHFQQLVKKSHEQFQHLKKGPHLKEDWSRAVGLDLPLK